MSRISEADALDQLRMLTELGESDAARQEIQGHGLGQPEEPGAKSSP